MGSWEIFVGALVSIGSASLGSLGVWLKVRGDVNARKLETHKANETTRITTGASAQIHIIDVLSERVTCVEATCEKQDLKIESLVADNASLRAQNTLLKEQNELLVKSNRQRKKQIEILREERDELHDEVEMLKDVVASEITNVD